MVVSSPPLGSASRAPLASRRFARVIGEKISGAVFFLRVFPEPPPPPRASPSFSPDPAPSFFAATPSSARTFASILGTVPAYLGAKSSSTSALSPATPTGRRRNVTA